MKSRTDFPPLGWEFIQPQIPGWRPPAGSFTAVTNAIIELRKGNPGIAKQYNLSTEESVVADELDAYNAQKCINHNWGHFVIEAPAVPFPRPAMPFKKLSAGVAGVRKVVAGIGAVREWLGDGLKPVAQELAEHRASVCVECPVNGDPNFLERLAEEGAREIRTQMDIKHDMAHRTKNDAKLFLCKACSCWLPLKVWAPLPYVTSRLSAAVRQSLDPKCWILEEMKAEATKLTH